MIHRLGQRGEQKGWRTLKPPPPVGQGQSGMGQLQGCPVPCAPCLGGRAGEALLVPV
jgi:hypothetical protein